MMNTSVFTKALMTTDKNAATMMATMIHPDNAGAGGGEDHDDVCKPLTGRWGWCEGDDGMALR